MSSKHDDELTDALNEAAESAEDFAREVLTGSSSKEGDSAKDDDDN